MDFLNFAGFAVSVWGAIIIGLFFIAMVIGCTFDRHFHESPKWWILFIGIVSFVIWQWPNLSWRGFLSRDLWNGVGLYLLVGLLYSIIEFALEVRRSARYWSTAWSKFKNNGNNSYDSSIPSTKDAIVRGFIRSHAQGYNYDQRIIGIDVNETTKEIEPKVNRTQLAESIGCWTFFWPFYAISLIIGDLVTEIFRLVADFVASISGRAVRAAFSNVFKF